ncbi:hypothetical protein HAX54_047630, partial [Datura stramonium]|nr:hypothetical protein [Datura stramonium]
ALFQKQSSRAPTPKHSPKEGGNSSRCLKYYKCHGFVNKMRECPNRREFNVMVDDHHCYNNVDVVKGVGNDGPQVEDDVVR